MPGVEGLLGVDAPAVALATYATRTLALDLATFGDDDAERSVAAKGVQLRFRFIRSSRDKGRHLRGSLAYDEQI